MAISKNGITGVRIDFLIITRISANVAESSDSSKNSFKSEMAICKVCIDFAEILTIAPTFGAISSGRSSI